MKVSIIVPTRKRVPRLAASLNSLVSTVQNAEMEFLFGLDDDDVETLEWLRNENLPNSLVFVGPRIGYTHLHEYVNSMARCASGDWLLIWNDEALMQTQGWDVITESFQGQMILINPQTNHNNHETGACIFPIIPKRMVEALGHVALNQHYDTYLEWIANRLGIRRDVSIYVMHDRPDLTGSTADDVYEERTFATSQFYSPENTALINKDAAILRALLD